MTALQKVLKSSGILAYKMFCKKEGKSESDYKNLKKYLREARQN